MTEDRWLIASLFYSMVHMCVQLLMASLLMLLKMHYLWVHVNEYRDSGLWILRLKRIYKRSRIVNMASLSWCFTKSLRVSFWWTLPLRPGRRKMRRRNEVSGKKTLMVERDASRCVFGRVSSLNLEISAFIAEARYKPFKLFWEFCYKV